MKPFYLLTVLFILFSCQKSEKIKIYAYKPISTNAVIRGQNLNDFFKDKSSTREMFIYEVTLTESLKFKLEDLKEEFINNMTVDMNGMGIYYVALIYKKDTLYSSSSMGQWKYKNKVGEYNSELIREKIKEVVEFDF